MSFARRMECWTSRNLLDLYVDERLTAGRAGRVREHLKACAGCSAEEKALRPVRLGGTVDVPAGLAAAILKEFEAGTEPRAVAAPAWRLQPAQMAALAYLAIAAGGNLGPGLTSEGLPNKPGVEAAP